MCELLALSSRLPTSVTSSLSTFARHRTSADGWGVGFYDGRDARLYKEPEPATESVWLESIQHRHLTATVVLGHIRHATRGGRSLANTQPFSRELGGRIHVFAHNGRLDTIDRDFAGGWTRYKPIGETDSEIAFCVLLERLVPLWAAGTPSLTERLAVFTQYAADMRTLGPANFLYSDGDTLFVHAHRRMQADGSIGPPGLWRLARRCACDSDVPTSERFGLGAREQKVMLFASVPLTTEPWVPLAEGEVLAVSHGAVSQLPESAAGALGSDAREAAAPLAVNGYAPPAGPSTRPSHA